jgi:glycosyltransferase involved in cell wall biosynthesis
MKSRRANIAIVIPAYNESATIEEVISGIRIYGTPIVVNDGSTDDTEHLAREAGAYVVSNSKKEGYDSAIRLGLKQAISEHFEFAITIDGDGQHRSIDIVSFKDSLIAGADIVVGIRKDFQRFSEKMFAIISNRLWNIYDPLCGMKGYRISKLADIINLSSYESIGTEIPIRASCSGWKIHQVHVETSRRKGRSRFGSGLYSECRILLALCNTLFRAKPYIRFRNNKQILNCKS